MSDALALPAPAQHRVLGRRTARVLRGAAGVLLLLAAWQVSVPLVGLSSYFYPAPSDVVASFVDLTRKGILPVYFMSPTTILGLGVGEGLDIGLDRKQHVTPLYGGAACNVYTGSVDHVRIEPGPHPPDSYANRPERFAQRDR